MSFKTIVCPMAASAQIDDLAAAVVLCRANELHLKIPLIEIEPPAPIAVEVPVTDIWADEMRQLRQQTGERARILESELTDQGLSAEVQALVSPVYQISNLAGLHGRFSDLTLSSASTRGSNDLRNRLHYGLLFESGRPMLVEPDVESFSLDLSPGTVLIAWDGGLQASRATMLATAMLKSARQVHVVCIDPQGGDAVDGQAPGWDLANYLARHQIEVTVNQVPSTGAEVDQVLARHATELGADLIVMGAYGHSRLRERFLGGTTKAVLEHCSVPVFMAH